MKGFYIGVALLSFAGTVIAGTTNLSTGYNSGGTLICASGSTSCSGNDANWTVIENNTGDNGINNNGATGPGQVVNSSDADWYDGWVANGTTVTSPASTTVPGSDWIAYDANYCCDNGLGTYDINFDLTGYNLSTVTLSGGWAVDDSGLLVLNGNTIGTVTDGWESLLPFSVNSGFNQGANTLQIQITSDDGYLEGVDCACTLTGELAATPEPSTWLLASTGLGIALFLRRRRRAG